MDIKLLFCIIFFYILLMAAWSYKTNMMQQQVGIVTKKMISVFAGPHELFYNKFQLHECDQVIIMDKQSGYYQVKADALVGWIHDCDVELI